MYICNVKQQVLKQKIMRTFDLVKSQIESSKLEPVMKRQIVNGKMEWILKNPETGKFAVISSEEVDILNNAFHIAKYGMSVNDDPFLLNA